MQISKWGNSLAVRLPKALVDQLGLKEGDELNVVAASKETIEVETKEAQRRRAIERPVEGRQPLTGSAALSLLGLVLDRFLAGGAQGQFLALLASTLIAQSPGAS